jgi:hypothetical protein
MILSFKNWIVLILILINYVLELFRLSILDKQSHYQMMIQLNKINN